MTGEKFTLLQYPISGILGLIETEQFVIPEIQRPFVWKRSQVRDLIDSLFIICLQTKAILNRKRRFSKQRTAVILHKIKIAKC